MSTASVRCVVVNYRTPWEMLKDCLDSVSASEAADCHVTLVDNGSDDGVIAQVRDRFPEVEIIEAGANLGFAAAVNLGIAAAREPLILLLNTDAMLTPSALTRMVDALEQAGSDCAGVAPKMMSSAHQGVIDAIGTVMPADGASFNRGIGQCDLGQYDRREEVFGTCFGATLIRRDLFEPAAVGPLYEGYFLYFEDSDWCLRARSQGYRFLTAPEAIVYHLHSGVTRHKALPFKYRLIELNTLKIVVRNFENPLLAAKIVAGRCLRLVARTVIRRKFIAANLSTLASFAVALPRLLQERRELGRRRIVSDSKIFRLAEGEDAFFDTVNYRPDRCLQALTATYLRLFQQKRDPATGQLLAALYRLRQLPPSGKGADPAGHARELFRQQPECAQHLLTLALDARSNAASTTGS